jgi:hypothetical protein
MITLSHVERERIAGGDFQFLKKIIIEERDRVVRQCATIREDHRYFQGMAYVLDVLTNALIKS